MRGRRRRPPALLLALLLAGMALGGLGVPAARGGPVAPDFLVPPHFSWPGDPRTAVTIAWTTVGERPTSAVRFGRTAGLELGERPARTFPFLEGFRGFNHVVALRGLEPGRVYYYAAGSDEGGWSAPAPFATAPATAVPFEFHVVADMGISASAQAVVRAMALVGSNFTLHAGDISYAAGNQEEWNRFMAMVEPLASGRAYMTVPGNHENETRAQLGSYLARFFMPPDANPDDPARSGLYYSFNYSNVHFIGLKADEAGGVYPADPRWDPLQTAWLQRDLAAAANDPAHPWIVVFFHFPPFSSSTDHGSWPVGRRVWGSLFDRYHVALVLTGHDHDYERTWPVWSNGTVAARNYTNPPAPVYVVTGGGGESHARIGARAPWSAAAAPVYEFLRVQVNGGVLTVAAIHAEGGSPLDCFTLVRGPPLAPLPSPCVPLPERAGRLLWGIPLWALAGTSAVAGLLVAVALRALRRHGAP